MRMRARGKKKGVKKKMGKNYTNSARNRHVSTGKICARFQVTSQHSNVSYQVNELSHLNGPPKPEKRGEVMRESLALFF